MVDCEGYQSAFDCAYDYVAHIMSSQIYARVRHKHGYEKYADGVVLVFKVFGGHHGYAEKCGCVCREKSESVTSVAVNYVHHIFDAFVVTGAVALNGVFYKVANLVGKQYRQCQEKQENHCLAVVGLRFSEKEEQQQRTNSKPHIFRRHVIEKRVEAFGV